MTPVDVRDVLALISLAYPARQVTAVGREAEQVTLWADILGPYTRDLVLAVTRDVLAEGREHPPTAGVIASRCRALTDEIEGRSVPDPDQVAEEILTAAGRFGLWGYQRVEWSHPVVAETVRSLGWRHICTSEEPETLRAQIRMAATSAGTRHRVKGQSPRGTAQAALEHDTNGPKRLDAGLGLPAL